MTDLSNVETTRKSDAKAIRGVRTSLKNGIAKLNSSFPGWISNLAAHEDIRPLEGLMMDEALAKSDRADLSLIVRTFTPFVPAKDAETGKTNWKKSDKRSFKLDEFEEVWTGSFRTTAKAMKGEPTQSTPGQRVTKLAAKLRAAFDKGEGVYCETTVKAAESLAKRLMKDEAAATEQAAAA